MDKDQRATLLLRVERATDIPMLVLAVAFLVIIALPLIRDISQSTQQLLEGTLWIIWAIFALELTIKTYLAPDRKQYLISHWLDVLTVAVPFLRPLRILRVIIVLLRTWQQMRTVLRKRTFTLIGITSLITIALSATLVYAFERHTDGPIQNLPDALWWAITTITTVGYGDTYPISYTGRGIAAFLMLTGISLFGLLTAKIAAFLVEEEKQESVDPQLSEILKRLTYLEEVNTQLLLTIQHTQYDPNKQTAQHNVNHNRQEKAEHTSTNKRLK